MPSDGRMPYQHQGKRKRGCSFEQPLLYAIGEGRHPSDRVGRRILLGHLDLYVRLLPD